jgi:hypothetical protein
VEQVGWLLACCSRRWYPEQRIRGTAKSNTVVHSKGLVKEGLVSKMSFTVELISSSPQEEKGRGS